VASETVDWETFDPMEWMDRPAVGMVWCDSVCASGRGRAAVGPRNRPAAVVCSRW
jgi:hypothetical protein